MYVGTNFDTVDPGESEPFTLDFANELPAGETIASSAWVCHLLDGGVDINPMSHIVGPATITGTKSTQLVANLVGGCRYQLQAYVNTTPGNFTLSLWSYVQCRKLVG